MPRQRVTPVRPVYEVYQPHTHGPEGINSAQVISRHRSPEAAHGAITTAQRRLQRQPGSERSWLDWRIRVREPADPFTVRPLTDDEVARVFEAVVCGERG